MESCVVTIQMKLPSSTFGDTVYYAVQDGFNFLVFE